MYRDVHDTDFGDFIAATLETQFSELIQTQPEVLARHCAEAGLVEKAVGYWLRAGQLAMARSAMTEAAARLHKGVDLLGTLPDGPLRWQQELDLQIALRPALTATKGLAAFEVGETVTRARAGGANESTRLPCAASVRSKHFSYLPI